jgi:DNA-binding transcriptional MerR regulator
MAFTIRELENISGIKAHTIRIWEQRYHFLKPSRTSTNIRTYSNEELKTLLTVALLNKYGFKISRIDQMNDEQRSREVLNLSNEQGKEEKTVNDLIGCMVDLDAEGFTRILKGNIEKNGIQKTLTSVVFQFLQRTGILWQTGRINPAHEHIVSNIIRQKLIAAIDELPSPRSQITFLLLLPEGEYHEIGLLYVSYLLKKARIQVLYLGANVPLDDAGYVIELKKPAYIYMHLTSLPSRLNFAAYLTGLSKSARKSMLVVSGSPMENFRKALPKNIEVLRSLEEVSRFISTV